MGLLALSKRSKNSFTRSGVSLVGENGPELLYGNRGASVVPLDHPAAAEATSGRSSVSAADVEAIAGRAAGEAMAGALAEVRRLAETLARMNVQPGF